MKLIAIVCGSHQEFINLIKNRPDNFIWVDPNHPEGLRGTAIDDYEIYGKYPDIDYIENSILKPLKYSKYFYNKYGTKFENTIKLELDLKATVETIDGSPTLCVNGKPFEDKDGNRNLDCHKEIKEKIEEVIEIIKSGDVK